MIIGQVNHRIEAIIPIHLMASEDEIVTLDAVIDTGFSGYLSLPIATITTLNMPFIETRTFSLGNDARADFDIYGATVRWHDLDRKVLVLASEAHPLAGMSLIKGFRMTINAVDGGEVRIESRA